MQAKCDRLFANFFGSFVRPVGSQDGLCEKEEWSHGIDIIFRYINWTGPRWKGDYWLVPRTVGIRMGKMDRSIFNSFTQYTVFVNWEQKSFYLLFLKGHFSLLFKKTWKTWIFAYCLCVRLLRMIAEKHQFISRSKRDTTAKAKGVGIIWKATGCTVNG